MTTKQNFSRIFLIGLTFIFILSCDKENPQETFPVYFEKLSGKVQKGPFLNGTSITIAELNGMMGQTGKNFGTQITDNSGSFELSQFGLNSQFVELKADGFYYNEIYDESSSARLILYALSNLSDKSTLNVNLLSHLEKDRVYHLIEEGLSFSEAKAKAQKEILRVFSIEKPDMKASELLDISQSGDEDAILLAISLILQGYHSVGELSELLANINTDIKEDGELNDAALGSELISQALYLKPVSIRTHLENRYKETGLEVELPDFEKYLDVFLENTDYEAVENDFYPEFSDYGENILFGNKTEFQSHTDYSMAADIPVGSTLTIKLSGGLWFYRVAPEGPVNWKISKYNFDTQTQTFTVTESGRPSDVSIQFDFYADSLSTGDGILVEYFENDASTPTREKVIKILP